MSGWFSGSQPLTHPEHLNLSRLILSPNTKSSQSGPQSQCVSSETVCVCPQSQCVRPQSQCVSSETVCVCPQSQFRQCVSSVTVCVLRVSADSVCPQSVKTVYVLRIRMCVSSESVCVLRINVCVRRVSADIVCPQSQCVSSVSHCVSSVSVTVCVLRVTLCPQRQCRQCVAINSLSQTRFFSLRSELVHMKEGGGGYCLWQPRIKLLYHKNLSRTNIQYKRNSSSC